MSLVAETGVQKKSVSTRKLKLRELNAENCVNFGKIRAPIKIKSALPPPKKPKIPPPPANEEFYGHRFSCRKERIFPGVHKIDAPISGPRIADKKFTDTRIFLITSVYAATPTQGTI